MRFASRAAKAKPSFRQPGLSAFHRVRISFWECKTWVLPTQSDCAP